MQLSFALALSLALHAAVILVPAWFGERQRPPATASIEARLMPPAMPSSMADAVSTEAEPSEPARLRPPPTTAPRALQGSALRRAQAALSEHLFYPPEAVSRGIEGEVILLLMLADNGQLVSAAIARSSGHPLLDEAALDAARHIGTLPGNPRQMLFPVRFLLQ